MMGKKKISFVLKLLVTAALIVLLVRNVEWRQILEEFSEASPALVLAAFCLYLAGLAISVSRWRQTALFKGFGLTYRDALRFHFAGLFLNNFLPSFIGGDAFRSYLLGRTVKRYSAAVSTVVFVRFVGLWAAVALFIVFGVMAPESILMRPVFLPFAIGLGLVLLLDVWITAYSDRHIVQRLYGLFPSALRAFFGEMSGFTDRKFLWESFLVSVVFSLVGVGFFNLALFWAFGEHVPIIPYLSVVFLTSVISSIPISINNIGVKEWAYYTFFPLIGIDPEAALAVALIGRFLQMFASLYGIPHYLRNRDGEHQTPVGSAESPLAPSRYDP